MWDTDLSLVFYYNILNLWSFHGFRYLNSTTIRFTLVYYGPSISVLKATVRPVTFVASDSRFTPQVLP